MDPAPADEIEELISAIEPTMIALERYFIEMLRMSHNPDRVEQSAAHTDVGHLNQCRREAVKAFFELRKFAR